MARVPGSARQRVGFLGHQVTEYVVGAALVAVGVHLAGPVAAVLVAVGAVLIALNVCSAGRLGAWRVLSHRAHHLADLALVAALACSPLTALGQLHVLGVVVAEVLAAFLLWVERSTRYAPGPVPGPVPAGPVPVATAAKAAQAGAAALATLAPPAGALAGRAARQGARRLGVAVGRSRRVLREVTGERARRQPAAAGTDAPGAAGRADPAGPPGS